MNSERNLEKLSKAELINLVEKLQNEARRPTEKPSSLVEKLQNKARKPKIAIVDYDNGQVPPQKPTRCIPPRDPKTGRFVKIHPDIPKPPKQPSLPRLRDQIGSSSRDGSQNP